MKMLKMYLFNSAVKIRATWNVERWSVVFRAVRVRKHWSRRKSDSAVTSSAERGTPEIGPRYPVTFQSAFLAPNSTPIPPQFRLNSSLIPPQFCSDSAGSISYRLLHRINCRILHTEQLLGWKLSHVVFRSVS